MKTASNQLKKAKSPYLLQHADNPVHWQPWGGEALKAAEAESKLVIVSIGYSACHWCHVMAHETFEDSAAAEYMNQYFVNIKIDREEHPDVDQVYMTAVQLMTGSGGWPLNVVCLPDGRPIWGGTYLPKQRWLNTLQNIVELYQNDPQKVLEYAQQLTDGVQKSETVLANEEKTDFSVEQAHSLVENWQTRFDRTEGGPNRAPKFPLPNNYAYLLQYGHTFNNEKALQQTERTLTKMAHGGIYDQIGGGFARYSTDMLWKAPHFEKMLYDNAQLISLYADAYKKYKIPLYENVVHQTIAWAEREMQGAEGQYYSALDADSEGEEGKFYVWTESELEDAIGSEDWQAFTEYYDLEKGLWEHNRIILMRNENVPFSLALESKWGEKLRQVRAKRIRPGTDDKALTSWNAMMISGLLDAHKAFPEKGYLTKAKNCAEWLMKYQNDDGILAHAYKDGEAYVAGLAEDYTYSIEAFIKLYLATADDDYLNYTGAWLQTQDNEFLDTATKLFYTRGKNQPQLISTSTEMADNVIPSCNSTMAKNLFLLGRILGNQAYINRAEQMLQQVSLDRFTAYGESYSNWAQLHLWFTTSFYETVVLGEQAKALQQQLNQAYLPYSFVIASAEENENPLFKNRLISGETMIYVCENQSCKLPVKSANEALQQMVR